MEPDRLFPGGVEIGAEALAREEDIETVENVVGAAEVVDVLAPCDGLLPGRLSRAVSTMPSNATTRSPVIAWSWAFSSALSRARPISTQEHFRVVRCGCRASIADILSAV